MDDTDNPVHSPEEVAREFIHSSGVLEPMEPVEQKWKRPGRLIGVLGGAIVIVAAGVGGVVLANHKSGDGGPSIASLQSTANRSAVDHGCPPSQKAPANTLSFAGPAQVMEANQLYEATVVTTVGDFTVALNAVNDPTIVNDFLFLAEKGYFDCVTFYRVVSGGFDETGDPTGTGNGTPGYTVPAQVSAPSATPTQQYALGSLVMANVGQTLNSSSQWLVVTGPEGEALPATYSLFGRVVAGMAVVNKINSEGSKVGIPPRVVERVLYVTIETAHS